MLDITQTEAEGTLTLRYTGELDQHAARQTIERSEDTGGRCECEGHHRGTSLGLP